MKMMVCYDGSEVSKEALRVAREYATVCSASLQVVVSVPANAGSEGGDHGWAALREELAGERGGTVVEIVADDVTDGENLVQYATTNGVDALFIGVRKVSKVGKLLFGSTAQYVILAAPCPVISVKTGSAPGSL